MDRGAARSRKRAQKADKPGPAPAEDNAQLAKLLAADGKGGKGGRRERDGNDSDRRGKGRPRKVREPAGPDQYKAKAIRTAQALVYAQAPFAIPPPAERLAGVTRVDLDGAECSDVSWIPEGVTWLSVRGCAVKEGWEVVGGLKGLTVLNISNCGLEALPAPLAGLKSLKALVATGNEWATLDEDVVAGWKELNSLILSHSPNLTALPSTLASLPHLSKLAFSHCPRLDAPGLPDLSPLPLLRDVKANNLARLSTLPPHLSSWGTGDLSAVGKSGSGDGLEVLDLGNCSLPYAAASTVFGISSAAHASKKEPRWPHLRSLTLRANPLALEVPAYAEQLQASADVPKLQIIDARRVKERARAGEVQESRRERKAREAREKKARPTGANEHAGGKAMRKWGAAEGEDEGEEGGEEEPKERKKERRRSDAADDRAERKKRRHEEPAAAADRKTDDGEKRKRGNADQPSEKAKRKRDDVPEPAPAAPADEAAKKKRKRKHGRGDDAGPDTLAVATPGKPVVVVKPTKTKTERAPAAAPIATHVAVADPAAQRARKPGRSETAVVGVVDVAPAKGKGGKGGLDLKAALQEESGSGLGVGGW